MKKFVLLILTILSVTEAFSVNRSISHRSPLSTTSTPGAVSISTLTPTLSRSNNNKNNNQSLLVLHDGPKSKEWRDAVYGDSEKRGTILLGFVLLLNVWIFSIPTELRRGHFCFTENCSLNRARCNDCLTFPEWFGEVRSYYANGGGINFDFSVEEKD